MTQVNSVGLGKGLRPGQGLELGLSLGSVCLRDELTGNNPEFRLEIRQSFADRTGCMVSCNVRQTAFV